MTTLTVGEKQAYFARTQRDNYAASLRLEGFTVKPRDASCPLPTKAELLNRYRQEKV